MVRCRRFGGAFLVVGMFDACSFAATVPDIPASVVKGLRDRGCKVPGAKSKDVISGQFFKAGQIDWVALCAGKESTSLLVFPNGGQEGVVVLETLQKGFSKWSIAIVSAVDLAPTLQGWLPGGAVIDHQGIISWVEFGAPGRCLFCSSAEGVTYYYHQDRWLPFARTTVN